MNHQRLLAHPMQHGLTVWGVQNILHGVAGMQRAYAIRSGQQVQVVVAQQAACRGPVAH